MKVTVDVPTQVIKDALISAFEGGSNYWYRIENKYKGHPVDNLMAGGTLEISDYFGLDRGDTMTVKQVTQKDIEEALTLMSKDYPMALGRILGNDSDAEDGDILLQLATWKKVIFG